MVIDYREVARKLLNKKIKTEKDIKILIKLSEWEGINKKIRRIEKMNEVAELYKRFKQTFEGSTCNFAGFEKEWNSLNKEQREILKEMLK